MDVNSFNGAGRKCRKNRVELPGLLVREFIQSDDRTVW